MAPATTPTATMARNPRAFARITCYLGVVLAVCFAVAACESADEPMGEAIPTLTDDPAYVKAVESAKLTPTDELAGKGLFYSYPDTFHGFDDCGQPALGRQFREMYRLVVKQCPHLSPEGKVFLGLAMDNLDRTYRRGIAWRRKYPERARTEAPNQSCEKPNGYSDKEIDALKQQISKLFEVARSGTPPLDEAVPGMCPDLAKQAPFPVPRTEPAPSAGSGKKAR